MAGSSFCHLFICKGEATVERHSEQLFKVEGMSCQHCVAAITRALQALDQSAEVKVDLPAGLVTVSTALSAAELQRTLAEEGYPATAVTA